ncbi:hypothetical protein AGMMS49991_11000 [Spirochaetia bacterium]|nr:hypothetical protein AGMMS49991_11000 [Spirochaetia bacterium]
MKKTNCFLYGLTALCVVLSVAACSNLLTDTPKGQKADTGTGYVTVHIGSASEAGARTLLPQPDNLAFDHYELIFTAVGGGAVSHTYDEPNLDEPFGLAPGTYDLALKAYLSPGTGDLAAVFGSTLIVRSPVPEMLKSRFPLLDLSIFQLTLLLYFPVPVTAAVN